MDIGSETEPELDSAKQNKKEHKLVQKSMFDNVTQFTAGRDSPDGFVPVFPRMYDSLKNGRLLQDSLTGTQRSDLHLFGSKQDNDKEVNENEEEEPYIKWKYLQFKMWLPTSAMQADEESRREWLSHSKTRATYFGQILFNNIASFEYNLSKNTYGHDAAQSHDLYVKVAVRQPITFRKCENKNVK